MNNASSNQPTQRPRRGLSRDTTPITIALDNPFHQPDKRQPSKPLAALLLRRLFPYRATMLKAVVAATVLLLLCTKLPHPLTKLRATLCHQQTTTPTTAEQTLDMFAERAVETRPAQWRSLTTLVIVVGHAIYTSSDWSTPSLHKEANWVLEPFQKGQVSTFLAHIEKGVQLAANDTTALLLFSGGQTRPGAGPRSEAMTYWTIANAAHWYRQAPAAQTANRSLAEEYARDSFENVLFSICRFRQVVGSYPRSIKVVGFEFKRHRFVNLHRRALRFPEARFHYFGIDPPTHAVAGKFGAAARERAMAMGPFASDPYGCHTNVLFTKRLRRNPYLRYHPYPQGCPEISRLFKHCGPALFRDPLPWDAHKLQEHKPVSVSV